MRRFQSHQLLVKGYDPTLVCVEVGSRDSSGDGAAGLYFGGEGCTIGMVVFSILGDGGVGEGCYMC